ncbi:MAG: Asr1405/Asl0597 family protein [Cyanobacteria bacterium P01_G01_bin.39]
MTPNESNFNNFQIIEIDRTESWFAYRRFQDLAIASSISTGQPLRVEISDPQTAVQVWSVIKQVTGSRSELIDWLENCWSMPIKNYN